MTTENYLILTICLLAILPICLGIAIVIGFISESIKEHRVDNHFYSEPYKVNDAKHLFCELYKNASEYEVHESADFEGCYLIQRKSYFMGKGYQSSYRDFINDDFDTPVDNEDDNADTPAS